MALFVEQLSTADFVFYLYHHDVRNNYGYPQENN